MGWLSFLDFLVEPTFIDRHHPPLNFKVSARVSGWIALVVSVVLLFALLLVGIGSVSQTRNPGHSGIFAIALIGFVLVAITQIAALVGALQMTRGKHSGRRLFIQAIVLSVIASLIYNIGLANLGQFILQLVIRGLLYYLALVSVFPGEVPSGTTGVVGGPPLS